MFLSESTQFERRLSALFLEVGSVFDIGRLTDRSLRRENIAQIRVRARAVPVAGGRVLCRSLGRYKLYVDGADVGFGAHLMLDGFWEIGVTEFIARSVRQGMTVLDIGANVGYYTLLMAELVGAAGRVIAFEPNPLSLLNLSDSVSINGFSERVAVRQEALWDRSGQTAEFMVPAREPKNASVVTADRAKTVLDGEHFVRVPTLALDDLRDAVDFAKVDIEGAEEMFWRGAQSFIERNPAITILLEFNSARCSNPGGLLDEICRLFPLRALDEASKVVAVEKEQILNTSHDWMLVLTRQGGV